MENRELIEKCVADVRFALDAYGKYTYQMTVLEDVSDKYIERVARDSVQAKTGLRELFRKSPVWDEDLQAIIINGTRTHNPDQNTIRGLACKMLEGHYEPWSKQSELLSWAVRLFYPNLDGLDREKAISAINELAPHAYAPGKKLSRVFRDLARAMGAWDETAGSEFQRNYAKFADELSAKQISFKLFVSAYAPYFITMSNPKGDSRGTMLTSCHSFNSTDYEYNNGCTGYARDKTSFIVFTVDDPTDKESLFNRKTTRQVFAYRPGSGILLQSRMYNTSGGTRGANELTPLYRDLVMREISALEDQANLWKTKAAYNGDYKNLVQIGCGFGGYADWTYGDFDGHISVRQDCDPDSAEPLEVGTYGLCVQCGEETEEGMYCDYCKANEYCEDCDAYHNETFLVYDPRGNERYVCEYCRDNHYTWCERCNDYHHNDAMHEVDGDYYCDDCIEYTNAAQCYECGEWHYMDNMHTVYDRYGDAVMVCNDCIDGYTVCAECGERHPTDYMVTVHRADGTETLVCESCAEEFDTCPDCGGHIRRRGDGMCPACGCLNEKTEKEAEAV